MGRIVQSKTTKTRSRKKKMPEGYHKCPNCGGDGVCKNLGNMKKRKKS